MNLDDRVTLVTGAARRVGRAIAVRLARSGSHIAVHCNRSREAAEETAEHCRSAGIEAEVFAADLDDPAATAELVPAVVARFGRLDVLVNNASVFDPMPVAEFTLGEWERTLRINLTAPMVLIHAARDALRRTRGCVVNLCDAATAQPWSNHIAYMASKAGIEMLTRVLAKALAPDVNVVGVAPGVAAWPEHYDQQTRDRLIAKIPLRRAGAPDDIAGAVHYLVTEGDYVTGTIIPVDGGRHLA
jgi:pteridine reductase